MRRGLGIFVLLFSCLFWWACVSFAHSKRTSLPPIAIEKIDVCPSNNKLQVILKTTGAFSYKSFLLPVKRSPKKLLVIDIWPAYLPQVKKVIGVKDPYVKRIKVSQYNKRTVRVVVQLAKLLPYQAKKGKNNLMLSIQRPGPQRKEKVCIKGVKVSHSNNKLQVILKTTGTFSYKSFLLSAKRSPKKRLVIDIWPAYLPQVKKVIGVKDSYVKRIKVSQYNKRTVRVVVQLAKLLPYQARKGKNNLMLSIQRPGPQRKKKVCIQGVKIAYPPPQGVELIVKTIGEPYYKDFFLPGILLKQLPPRLVIDLWPAYLPKGAKEEVRVTHPLVSQLRLAQFNKQTVRIVLSLKTEKIPYKIKFQENNLILTAFVTAALEKTSLSLPQVLGLKIRNIVIDPGHGGKDPGAIGYRGLKEKDVTLRLAKLLKQELEAYLGCQVILTRYKDEYVPLEKRAALANRVKADLFISLHCNACPSHRLHGTETYFLGLTDDKYALAVAARENASLNRRRGELDEILLDLLVKAKIKESAYLAAKIQENLVRHMRSKKYNPVTNLGVKQAPFYVLIGTDMPAVLVETAFIDHFREGRRLHDPNYLNAVAEGILSGIKSYIRTIEAYKYSPMEAGKGG